MSNMPASGSGIIMVGRRRRHETLDPAARRHDDRDDLDDRFVVGDRNDPDEADDRGDRQVVDDLDVIEVERKFLVEDDRWRDDGHDDGSTIVQGYLAVTDDREVRVRVRDGEATLTVKIGGRRRERRELETSLDAMDAQQLLSRACVGRTIRKTRYRVPAATADGRARTIEVDVFHGELSGLVLAEVELPGPDAALPEVSWLGDDVTDRPRFYGAVLATTDMLPTEAGTGYPEPGR